MKTTTDKRIEELQAQVLELTAMVNQASDLLTSLSRLCRESTDAAVMGWMMRRNKIVKSR